MYYYRAVGSRMRVVPDIADLVWQPATSAISVPQEHTDRGVSDATMEQSGGLHLTSFLDNRWFGVLLSVVLAFLVGRKGLLTDYCTSRARTWLAFIVSIGVADADHFT